MDTNIVNLNCLYYPFSRLLDETTLKYLLLVYDTVTFLDEVESSEWRRVLMQNQSDAIPYFKNYEKLADDYEMLAECNSIKIVHPKQLDTSKSQSVAMATLADLEDKEFIEIASKPSNYGLDARPLGYYLRTSDKRLAWETFIGKIASPLLFDDQFTNSREWMKHILQPGNEDTSWLFSYEAGSAAVTNFYLEAANELRLTPVTTSELHHTLVLRKLKRIFAEDKNRINLIDDVQRKRFRTVFGQGEIIRILGELYPPESLSKVSFEKIIKFREETKDLRRKFITEIDEILRVIDSNPESTSYDKEVVEGLKVIKNNFKKLESDLITVRDKILPAFAEALLYGTTGGGVLSTFISFFGGMTPSGIVTTSALTVSGAFLVKAIDIWNRKRELLRSQPSSVSYLAKVSHMVNS